MTQGREGLLWVLLRKLADNDLFVGAMTAAAIGVAAAGLTAAVWFVSMILWGWGLG